MKRRDLLQADIEMFAGFGIDRPLLDQAGIFRIRDEDAADYCFRAEGCLSYAGIVFPYHDPVHGDPVTRRLRRDEPESDTDGKPLRKYLQSYGDRNHLYFPPRAGALLKRTDATAILVEAEKSALAMEGAAGRTGRTLLIIATGGCWGWRGRTGKTTAPNGERVDERGPCPDLDLVDWRGRDAVILFDSNTAVNHDVQAARDMLARELRQRGARVRIGTTPAEEGVNGPDDYRARHDDAALLSLVDSAVAAEDDEPAEEILDESPLTMTRPLARLGGRGYAAAWVWIGNGADRRLELVVLREDGTIFTDRAIRGARPMRELGLRLALREPPPESRLWSGSGVKRFVEGHRPRPADVFRRVCEVVDALIDFDRSLADQHTMAELVGCYVFATYTLDAFDVIGYLWPNGERGSGKTHLLSVVSELAFLGQLVLAGGSFASLRDLADYGACLAFDDCETIMDTGRADPDKRSLLLAGNRRGTYVPLKEPGRGTREWVTRRVHAFAPRLFSAINLPDPVLGSRTITIPLVRSLDAHRAKAEPTDHATWPHERGLLVDDLWAMALAGLTRLRQYNAEVCSNTRLIGRDLEPWRAVLAMALWLQRDHEVTGVFDRLEELAASSYQRERRELEADDPVRILILALDRLVPAGCAARSLSVSDITAAANAVAIEREITPAGANPFNVKSVGHRLTRLRFEKPYMRKGNARERIVSRERVEQLAAAYGVQLTRPGKIDENGDIGSLAEPPICRSSQSCQSSDADDNPASSEFGFQQRLSRA